MNRYLEALFTVPRGLMLLDNPYEALKHILGISKLETVVYQLPHGVDLYVPNRKRDRPTIMTVYEIFGRRVYPLPDKMPLTVIDIGAQSGIFALYCAVKNPQTEIYCYEPDASNFRQLERNLRENPVLGKRITAFQKAVKALSGQTALYVDESSSRAHSTIMQNGRQETLVEAVNLPSIFADLGLDNCDILKMDAEGAEYEILYNCPPEVLRKIKRLYVECHPCQNYGENYSQEGMKSFLRNQGFRITARHGLVVHAERERTT